MVEQYSIGLAGFGLCCSKSEVEVGSVLPSAFASLSRIFLQGLHTRPSLPSM